MKVAAFTVQCGEQKAAGRHDSRLSVSQGGTIRKNRAGSLPGPFVIGEEEMVSN